MSKWRLSIIVISSLFLCLLFVLISWTVQLNLTITESLKQKKLTPIKEYYASGEQIFVLQNLDTNTLKVWLDELNFREKLKGKLNSNEYKFLNNESCAEDYIKYFDEDPAQCVELFMGKDLLQENDSHYLIAINSEHKVQRIINLIKNEIENVIELKPKLFAQYFGDKPIIRDNYLLGDTPPLCLNAILAIEDPDFLNHNGVSPKAILRALIKNIQAGRKAQGGSTITQQLVKNYFLSHKKTYSRKVKEIIMSILLEMKSSKDEILEAYINEIYMAQNGVFEVRGFGAAAKHFFGKDLKNINLAECSLLAAILNSPGTYNPFRNPEKALARRNIVINKLFEKSVIIEEEKQEALNYPLPTSKPKNVIHPAPYFLDAVKNQLEELNINTEQSLKIITTLNIRSQIAAEKAINNGINKLETWYKHLIKNKEDGKMLQAAIVTADPTNGFVTSLVGGRSYKTSPYNRIINSHRQVGSIMKPFVYLTALETTNSLGNPYTPISILEDKKKTYKYDGLEWAPKNYSKNYNGNVPMYYALKSSLNAATAALGMEVGLDNIINLARKLGLKSELKPFPALSLGAYELHPWEVLQAYASLARLGEKTNLTYIDRVFDSQDQKIFQHEIIHDQVISSDSVAVLDGMLKQTIETGTAQVVRKLGFMHPAAGKTGTTSDSKDAWFAGFTPFHVAIVWLGYDNNESHGLTGASGAAPIWTDYMKEFASQYPALDFRWPDNTSLYSLSEDEQIDLGVPNTTSKGETIELNDVELVFKKGTEP